MAKGRVASTVHNALFLPLLLAVLAGCCASGCAAALPAGGSPTALDSSLPVAAVAGPEVPLPSPPPRDLQSTEPPLEVRIGATLGLTGHFSLVTPNVQRGFLFFAAAVNSEGPFAGRPPPFRLASGRPIRVKLDILEDGGYEHNVVRLYEEMVASGSYDLFLAPYSSDLTIEAARVTDTAGAILFAHNAATRSIYTDNNFTYVFTTDVMADVYMSDAVNLLRDLGAETLVAVWEEGPFQEAACVGGVEHAEKIGFKVLAKFGVNPQDLTGDVRRSSLLMPDVFMGCGHIVDSINIVMTSRGLGFSPKAMVLTQSTTDVFIDAVGTPNANYLIGPEPWHEEAVQPGSNSEELFITASSFVPLFREMFDGVGPTYHSASAVAAGLALIAAVEEAGAVGPADEIRRVLLSMERDSFYGRFKFDEYGVLQDRTSYSVQVQPVDEPAPPTVRFTTSRVHLVSGRPEAVLWPMLTWDEKELEVFPCAAGSVVVLADKSNDTDDDDAAPLHCELCPVGRHRPQSSVSCVDCGVGFYSDVEGMERCKVCPAGADCDDRPHRGLPMAKAGFYRLPSKTMYVECDPPHQCLEHNLCDSNHAGIRCAQCERGFTRTRAFQGEEHNCIPCPSNFLLLISIVVVGLILLSFIFILWRIIILAAGSFHSVHLIIVKKMLTHWQLAVTTLAAVRLREVKGIGAIMHLGDLSQNPVKKIMSLECFLTSYKVYQIQVSAGLFIIPIAFGINLAAYFLSRHFKKKSFRKAQWFNARFFVNNMLETARPSGAAQEEEKAPDLSSSSDDEEEVVETKMDKRWLKLQHTKVLCIHGLIASGFLLHPIAVEMLLHGATCQELDVMRLSSDLDTECYVGDHSRWWYYSLGGLVLYGGGLPLLYFIFLFRVRNRLARPSVRRLYGFLYMGFVTKFFYFEVVHMIRKVLILVVAAIPVVYVRMVAMCCLSYAAFAMQIFFVPYDSRCYGILNRLEATSLIGIILVLKTRLFFDLRSQIETSSPFVYFLVSHKTLDVVLVLSCIGVHLYFWVLAWWSLLSNSIIKVLHLKAEVIEESLTAFDKTLLVLEPHKHMIKFDPETHALDLSSLSNKERGFLELALCETIEHYISTNMLFHPGRLLTAVRRAMLLALKDRERRATELLLIMRMTKNMGKWQRLLRWLRLLRALVIGTAKGGKDHKKGGMKSAVKRHLAKRLPANSCTVEELQTALMMCWPEITERKPRFFVVEKPAGFEAKMERRQAAQLRHAEQRAAEGAALEQQRLEAEAATKDYEDAIVESAERPQFTKRQIVKALAVALRPMDMNPVTIRARHADLAQEVWLLKLEVAALQEHLLNVRMFDSAPHLDHETSTDPGDAGQGTESPRSHRTACSRGPTLSVVGRHGEDLEEKVIQLVGKLLHKNRREEAAKVCALGARLVAMQWAVQTTGGREAVANHMAASAAAHAWPMTPATPGTTRSKDRMSRISRITTPSQRSQGVGSAQGGGSESMSIWSTDGSQRLNAANKVIDALNIGVGWTGLEAAAEWDVAETRRIAARLRLTGLEKEGILLDALALKLGKGLVGPEGAITVQRLSGGANSNELNSDLDGLEVRAREQIIHLLEIERKEEAEKLQQHCNRLLALRHMRRSSSKRKPVRMQSPSSGGATPPRQESPFSQESEQQASPAHRPPMSAEQLVQSLEQDPLWLEMGSVVTGGIMSISAVANNLKAVGLEEEAEALSRFVDDLAQGLVADFSRQSDGGHPADAPPSTSGE